MLATSSSTGQGIPNALRLETGAFRTEPSVTQVQIDDNRAYIAGNFTVASSVLQQQDLAELVSETLEPTNWVPEPPPILIPPYGRQNDESRYRFVVQERHWYVSRSSSMICVEPAFTCPSSLQLFSLSDQGALKVDWQPKPVKGYVITFAHFPGRGILLGGNFDAFGGVARENVAALDVKTGEATSWNPSASGQVTSLKSTATELFLAGRFQSIGGEPRNGFAAFETANETLSPWDPLRPESTETPGFILSTLEVSNELLLMSGRVIEGELPRPVLRAFSLSNKSLLPWQPLVEGGWPHSMRAEDDTLFIWGSFSSVNSNTRDGIASFRLPNLELTSFDPTGAFVGLGSVNDVALSKERIFVSLNSYYRPEVQVPLVALDRNTGSRVSWAPQGIPVSELYPKSVAVIGETLYYTQYRILSALEFDVTTGLPRASSLPMRSAFYPERQPLVALNGVLIEQSYPQIIVGQFNTKDVPLSPSVSAPVPKVSSVTTTESSESMLPTARGLPAPQVKVRGNTITVLVRGAVMPQGTYVVRALESSKRMKLERKVRIKNNRTRIRVRFQLPGRSKWTIWYAALSSPDVALSEEAKVSLGKVGIRRVRLLKT